MTRVTTVNASRLVSGSPAASCVGKEHDRDAAGPVVRRVGVTGESVTFRSSSGLAILACDDSGGRREDERRWCGGALGRLERGRLSDPRLDLAGCVSAAGEPLAFAWMEPGRGTSFVAVRQDGFVEVYRAAGGLPVRVTSTTGIDLQRSSASFEISEHDANGRLIRAYTLEAQVAG